MKSNATFREIGEILEKQGSVAVLPHISPDGDGLGSAIAMARALRGQGIEATVVLEEDVPNYIAFLNTEFCAKIDEYIGAPDACMCIDCSEESRIPSRVGLWESADVTLCVDHHQAKEAFGDYYYIDESAAAAAELVYMIIDEMGWELDIDGATALYTGIVTDTGSFQYSNTTRQTHEIAGALIERGVNVNDVSVELFQKVPFNQMRTELKVLDTLEVFADGKAGIVYATEEMFRDIGGTADDAQGVIDIVRNIAGVEIAAFLKEKEVAGEMVVKASLRAKTDANVLHIAQQFKGGGHVKAAGCTLHEDIETAVELMKATIAETLA